MSWTIDIKNSALKQLNALDKPNRERIRNFLHKLSALDNPRINGKALQGALSSYWRYRVGDYRLICQIRDHELIVLVVEIGRRKDIYQKS